MTDADKGTGRYRSYLLTVLLVILACNYVDRYALGLLLQDIKLDLHLTDTQLGLLTGIAFALFYSVMGIPIARWADRGNRVTIITLSTALWSVAVALCGMAGNLVQLLLVRVAVAVGEAGCIPPAHSLIADYYSRAERARAVARYMLGAPLAVLIGYYVAGWLNEFYGWRVTFVVLGLPGLALSILAWSTLKEPRRLLAQRDSSPALLADASHSATQEAPSAGFKEVCVTLWTNRAFRHLVLGLSITYFFGYGITQWKPAFFMRSFGLKTGELGTWLALITGLGGLFGTYLGGELASRFASQNERLQLKAAAIAYCCFGFLSAGTYLAPTQPIAFGLVACVTVGYTMVNGPLFATVQTLVPARMRAMSIAMVYLFANLIGMGLGPLAAGALSDVLHARFGEESLRYALLAMSPGYPWAGWHLWRASLTVNEDIRRTLC